MAVVIAVIGLSSPLVFFFFYYYQQCVTHILTLLCWRCCSVYILVFPPAASAVFNMVFVGFLKEYIETFLCC